jgi:hypothetical protein
LENARSAFTVFSSRWSSFTLAAMALATYLRGTGPKWKLFSQRRKKELSKTEEENNSFSFAISLNILAHETEGTLRREKP